jgi:hypothetical protein
MSLINPSRGAGSGGKHISFYVLLTPKRLLKMHIGAQKTAFGDSQAEDTISAAIYLFSSRNAGYGAK